MSRFAFGSLAAIALADAFDPTVTSKFQAWMETYGKSYNSNGDDYDKALKAFAANDEMINSHNAEEGTSWFLGHNQFSDLTPAVFKHRLMRKQKDSAPKFPVAWELLNNSIAVPTEIDWVAKGAVTPIKDQANCGSCWAFGTVGAIEGAYAVASGKLVSLSEQNLVSCSFNGNHGCAGGEQVSAICWAYHNQGLCLEKDYPYVSGGGKDGYACKTSCKPAVAVSGYKSVPKGNEDALIQAVLLGPVTIGIDAAADAFMVYDHGIMQGKCGTQLDHAVLIVGFGTGTAGPEAKKPYWRIKNSWSTKWGEKGYFRVIRGKDECGVADGASYAIDARAADAAPAPPTEQCPKIPPPAPRLPLAYYVNITQTWGDPDFPGSGIMAVDYNAQKMVNTGYYLLSPDVSLWRCDINPAADGKSYSIGDKGKCVDGATADPPLNCPWSRLGDELMNGLTAAAPQTKGTACPTSPYGGGMGKGTLCDSWITGAGTDTETTFWLTSKDNVPVKEFQQAKGKGGFKVTSWFTNWKEGAPDAKLFHIPKKCPKAEESASIVV